MGGQRQHAFRFETSFQTLTFSLSLSLSLSLTLLSARLNTPHSLFSFSHSITQPHTRAGISRTFFTLIHKFLSGGRLGSIVYGSDLFFRSQKIKDMKSHPEGERVRKRERQRGEIERVCIYRNCSQRNRERDIFSIYTNERVNTFVTV